MVRESFVVLKHIIGSLASRSRLRRRNSNVFAIFDDKQIIEFQEAFSVIDVDSDGYIDKEDLRDMLHSLGEHPTDQYLDDMINEAPGNINFATFLTLMAGKLCATDTEEELIKAFEMIDEERKGVIPVDRFRYLMTRMGDRFTDKEFDAMTAGVIDSRNNFNYRDFVRALRHGNLDK
ncbi:4728_t:CDS:2 [Paraglomus occultum]|uniref:4728_t:CDS:1 n=1 Tax=Paraglomus occultum TaxID=144539 RepID=A0A9N9B217_9GLOM|nr:4728_t:CDS:2 [Paraglomus occultum]